MTPAGMRINEAAAYLGISRNTLKRHGPKPVRLGPRTVVWTRASLDAWLASKSATTARADADAATEIAVHAIRQARNPKARRRVR